MDKPRLVIVVPCYNEEAVLPASQEGLLKVLHRLIDAELISPNSQCLFVDDGSDDNTWSLIEEGVRIFPNVAGLKLSRNVGHQKALLAGLTAASEDADCVISIDADLQDDPDVMDQFLQKYHEGYDIVYGVRKKRTTDTAFKRMTAEGFYKFMNKIDIPLIYNHADYRLLSRRALEALLQFKEKNLFLRGLVPLVGFESAKVFYDRSSRAAGESKYPLSKMLAFAFDGLTSFTIKPIRVITVIGLLSACISFFAGVYAITSDFFGTTTSGWTSLMISLWFIGGLMLISIGMIGEYIGKIYTEVKDRPPFIIEKDLYRTSDKNRLERFIHHDHQERV